MLCVVKMLLKGEVGGRALNSHGNYTVDHGKSWNNHGIVFLNFCGNPDLRSHSDPQKLYMHVSYDKMHSIALTGKKYVTLQFLLDFHEIYTKIENYDSGNNIYHFGKFCSVF